MSISRRSVLAGAVAASAWPARASIAGPLVHAMRSCRFVSYQPTAIKAFNGNLTRADSASIAADLRALRPWFDGLVTYSATNGAERVPDIAASLGFKAVVLGIFDIRDTAEIENALATIKRNRKLIVGCGVGNETILASRGGWSALAQAVERVKHESGIAVATTEPFAEYLDHKEASLVLAQMDFMLVNIHPIFESWFKSGTAKNWTEFVTSVCDRLAARFKGPILVKETGVPSAPVSSGFNEKMQHDFWRTLEARMKPSSTRAFSYFTGFDSPWRAWDATPVSGPRPEEAHWGLFTEARAPKPVMDDLPRLG